MLFATTSGVLLLQASLALAGKPSPPPSGTDKLVAACKQIQKALSPASALFWPGEEGYNRDISRHWSVAVIQQAACTVEPATTQDVSAILKIVGSCKVPFSVKGGGHSPNPGFASSNGVQIAMTRFNKVEYDASSKSVKVGSGLIFDEVYSALAPYNRTVVGGRVTGIGVAGFTLGGGYSWHTNQYGLAVDNVLSYELVKPSGMIVTVTERSDSELFWGLKGGLNNFGIVTRFTLVTHPQGPVWGGLSFYMGPAVDPIAKAVQRFADNVKDPKAVIIATMGFMQGLPTIALLSFYDGPAPPANIFDEFLAIPTVFQDVGSRSFLQLVQTTPRDPTLRQGFHTFPATRYSPTLLNGILTEANTLFAQFSASNTTLNLGWAVEPFLPSAFTKSKSPSAYPPPSVRQKAYLPTCITWGWPQELAAQDATFFDAIKKSGDRLKQIAIQDGQDVKKGLVYPNYARFDTPLEEIYGESLPRLKALKKKVDPTDVMGLAGGWKF